MSSLLRLLVVGAPALAALAITAPPAARAEDKSGYNLFNPTPVELMRELSPDRPDATESPITVDAGHFQIETSLLDYSYDNEKDGATRAWTASDVNLKVGLTNNTDLQFILPAYVVETNDPDPGSSDTLRGLGDAAIRLKINLWGNDPDDGQTTAFGVMPFVTLPTGTDIGSDHVGGGFIAMLGWDVAETWGLGFMAEVDAVPDEEDDSYDAEFIHTAVLGADIADPLGGYVEYVGILSSYADTEYQAIGSTGLTYALNTDFALDIGVRIGLNKAAEDAGFFTGFTWRF